MDKPETYDNYPCRTIVVSNAFSIAAYAIGAFVIHQLGTVWLLLYLLLIIALEIRLLRTGCVACHYYGRWCAFGKGKISALLFRKGDPRRFTDRKVTWKDLLPDLTVPLIPIIAGAVSLILDFRWPVLFAVMALTILATVGNGFVRGSLACRMCRQRELGCPAQRFFSKNRR